MKMKLSIALLLCACYSRADEIVHLDNGHELLCSRHEQLGNVTRLYLDASGFIDMPTRQIQGFETSADVPVLTPHSSSTNLPEKREPAPLDTKSIRKQIEIAAQATGVDPDFIESVIRTESAYNVAAVSPKGARGLMQLMPSTAALLGVKDSLNAEANIDGGSRYLHDLLVRYDGDAVKALAAYNAGPSRVEQYKGVPPYRETRTYVARVIRDFNHRKLAKSKAASSKSTAPKN